MLSPQNTMASDTSTSEQPVSRTRGKVVLFYPPYDGPPLGAPLCLLALAGALRAAGITPVIIDAAIDHSYLRRVLEEAKDALCVGLSVLTGPMIRGAMEVASAIKQVYPELPVVFGGWHPTLMPEQTLAEQFVDVVVRGQGERTLVELATTYAEGGPLDLIAGITWKHGTRVVSNLERRVVPIDYFPPPAYDLVDFDRYESLNGYRKLAYATSVGCPYACNYCTDMVVYKRRFNAYSAEHVIEELIDLVKRYRIDEVSLLDSNFPVDLKRALAIARGIRDSGTHFTWTFQASTDFLCRMSQEEVQLLADSGVRVIGFGTESTSERVLKLMNKRHQVVEEMYETAEKTHSARIKINFNLILGYPGETEDDRVYTFQTMTDIARRFDNVSFSPNIFTPYPGIPIWPQLREMGLAEPKSLADWTSVSLGANKLPWLQGEELLRLDRMLSYFLLNNHLQRKKLGSSWKAGVLQTLISKPVCWRLRSRRFSIPWELWISKFIGSIPSRRSLVTGEVLPKPTAVAC